jgi:hypothetical protein
MDAEPDKNEKRTGAHNFKLFILGAVTLATVIVFISMNIYYGSGAAQLDLSRPGYVSVRAQASDANTDFQNFPSNGKLSVKVIQSFKSQYSLQAQKVKAVDAFGGDPLSPSVLGIDGQTTFEKL